MTKCLLLRPKHKAPKSEQSFRSAGIGVEVISLIETQVIPQTVNNLITFLQSSSARKTVIITSTVVADLLSKYPQQLSTHYLITVGSASREILQRAGITAHSSCTETSEGIVDKLQQNPTLLHNVCLVKGVGGRQLLPSYLQQQCHQYDCFDVYRRNNISMNLSDLTWKIREIQCIISTSSQQMCRAFALFDRQWLISRVWIVVSDRAVEQAKNMGIQTVICSHGASDQQLIKAVKELRSDT